LKITARAKSLIYAVSPPGLEKARDGAAFVGVRMRTRSKASPPAKDGAPIFW
jgi:hypothetical protein